MADKGRTQTDMLNSITEIRAHNNDLWMGILTIALQCSPEETKELIRGITKNDTRVTLEMRNIADAIDLSD